MLAYPVPKEAIRKRTERRPIKTAKSGTNLLHTAVFRDGKETALTRYVGKSHAVAVATWLVPKNSVNVTAYGVLLSSALGQ